VGSTLKRCAALALAAPLVAAAALVAASSSQSSSAAGVTTGRVGGANRYATSALAAEQAFPHGSPVAVLASGADFPDALSASGLAGDLDAPLLITDPSSLSPETLAGLQALKVTTVYVVGGSVAVGPAVLSMLTADGFTIGKQYGGVNRYDTSAQIAEDMSARGLIGKMGGARAAFVVSGTNFPDGVAAGAPAWKYHLPVIVTDPNTLRPETIAALTAAGIVHVLIVGGPGAVSPAVEQAINALGISTFKRFAGTSRYDTAVQLAYYEIDFASSAPPPGFTPAFDQTNGLLITGLNFPDALTASSYAGVFGWPILFDDPLPPETVAYFATVHPTTITAIGSTNAVPDADLSQAQQDAEQGLAATTTTTSTTTTLAPPPVGCPPGCLG
jgi:putative cell wall-binding protein